MSDILFHDERWKNRKAWMQTDTDLAKSMWLYSACEEKILEAMASRPSSHSAKTMFAYSRYSRAMNSYATSKEQRAFRWRWK